MTKKAEFNADEWTTLVEGPMLAGMRVVTAGRGGTIRETIAMAQTYAQARAKHGESELLDDLVASPPAMDPSRVKGMGDLATAATSRLREAVALLEAKATPEEVQAYKAFVLSLGRAAAEAHREGGFLGVGGSQVSETEQAALDEIAATLGTT